MPFDAPHQCANPNCRRRTTARYCPACRRDVQRSQDADRGTATQRGYGAWWRKYRMHYLREHPWCVDPYKRHRGHQAATVIDHRIPHKGDIGLFRNPKNHQGLCDDCHRIKTAREDGGFGRPVKPQPPTDLSTDLDEFA
jgi:5-methylcytosine-specific restriction protein A